MIMTFTVNLKQVGDMTYDNLVDLFQGSASIYDRDPTNDDILMMIELAHELYNRLPVSLDHKQIDDVVTRILHPEDYTD
jgi:hypothetical protein